MSRVRLLGVLAAVAAVGVTAVPATASAAPVITFSGSTSVAPLASLLARQYLKQYPGRVKFKLAQGGSDVGVADVAAGRVSIGNSSRDPKSSDPGGLVFNKIAKDAICVATNPSNPIANLTQAQIQAIFSGKVRDWGQVPGAKATGTINVVVRTAGVRHAGRLPEDLHGLGVRPRSRQREGLQRPRAEAVQTDPQAIGYVSLDFVDGLNASPLQRHRVQPAQRQVR